MIIGYDNTEDSVSAPIELNEDYIGCEIYDWAHDVTENQAEILKTGTEKEKIDIMFQITGDNVEWFAPSK